MSEDLINLMLEGETFGEKVSWKRAPFSIPGAKFRSLSEIVPIINTYLNGKTTFIDVFGGTGIVSFNIKQVGARIFNDRYSGIVDFYTQVRDNCELLVKLIESFPPQSRQQWEEAREVWVDTDDPLLRAALWYYYTVCSVMGEGSSFARSKTKLQPTSHGKLEIFDRVKHWAKNVSLENRDCFDIVPEYDRKNAVYYMDVPYLGTAQHAFKCEGKTKKWTETDLEDVLKLIKCTKGTVLLSHYQNDLIETQTFWTGCHAWNCRTTSDNVHSIESKFEREYLWVKDHSSI